LSAKPTTPSAWSSVIQVAVDDRFKAPLPR
jgi:hypothetical protein